MPNSIELMKKYVPYLDVAYREGSFTSIFDVNNSLIQAGKTPRSVFVPVMIVDGLADYSRSNGYVSRSTSISFKEYEYDYDRGGKFTVDSMDNAETDSLAFGSLAGRFMADSVTPEIDAYRFAKYAGIEGISKSEETLLSAEDTLESLRAAMSVMDENEVSAKSRYLFITPTLRSAIDDLDTTKSRAVLSEFAGVIKVPQRRFYTAIDLLDGESENEIAGGYKKASGGADINFMIIEKSAIIQTSKHTVSKIISPEANQTADAWMFFYRAYGLADVYRNKTNGIYLSHKPVAAAETNTETDTETNTEDNG